MSKITSGIAFGFDANGEPVSVSLFGGDVQTTRRDAMNFCRKGGLAVKVFERGSEESHQVIDRLAGNAKRLA